MAGAVALCGVGQARSLLAVGQIGTVAFADDGFGQAVLMRRHRCSLAAPRSSVAGFRFPPDVIGSGARKSNTGGSRTMPMDAYRDGNQLIIQFDMPGIDPDSLEINVENNTLPATCYRVHCCQASSSGCSSSYPR
jgi:hypothetical protein